MNTINDSRDTEYAARMMRRTTRGVAPPKPQRMQRYIATPERGFFSNEDHFTEPIVSQYDVHRKFMTTPYRGTRPRYFNY